MSQQTINTPRDTTIQATNTALGLLGKDASLQDIKAALLQIVAALDPTADDYDDLSNKPQVNGVTLSGNKTSKQLGIRQTIPLTSAQYAQLTSAEKMDVDKDYIITDENATAAPIDDSTTSLNSVWSSYKTDAELDALNSNITNKSNLLSVQKTSYTSDISVPASGYASGTVSCARTGYTPLGVVGFAGSNNNKVSLNDVYITGTTVTFYLVNLGASVTNVKYAAYVLYVKD